MRIDDSNAHRKLAALRANVVVAAREGIKDSGAFLMQKIKDVTINSPGHGETIRNTPQPPHDVAGGKYVRRRSGGLVGAVSMRVRASQVRIYMNQSKAQYSQDVLDWSRRKYGRTYMTIAVQQYRKAIETIFAKEVGRAIEAADNDRPYTYENHFPL